MSNSQKVGEKGLLIILSSPSGAGKSTLAQRIKSWDENCVFSISATTRKPRKGEQDGKDYYFISENEFRKKVSNSEMLEHAEVFETYMEAQYLQYYLQLITEMMFYLMLTGRKPTNQKLKVGKVCFIDLYSTAIH